MNNKRFEALDAFRGLCALSIVMFHMRWVGSIAELSYFKNSWILVEFFFVLSGFVLAHGYGLRDNLNFKTFMKARFFRLYPLHFAMFVFVVLHQLALLIAINNGLHYDNVPFTDKHDLGGIIPNLLLIHSWTPYTNMLSFNSPSWSVSIEFYMYALLFVSIAAFKGKRVFAWLAISLLAFLVMHEGSKFIIYQALKGIGLFFGGACMYVLYKKISHLKPSFTIGSAVEALLLLLLVLVLQLNQLEHPVIAPTLFFLTILFFAFESGYISNLLKLKPFQYMGTLSYSLYMTHAVILMYISTMFKLLESYAGLETQLTLNNKEYMTLGNAAINNLAVVIILGTIIYLSSLSYKHIELKGKALNKRQEGR